MAKLTIFVLSLRKYFFYAQIGEITFFQVREEVCKMPRGIKRKEPFQATFFRRAKTTIILEPIMPFRSLDEFLYLLKTETA